ncbi:hypothetical protein ASC94_11855 [Massilia sp. Root418]|uniref:ShlB/FhaC/HecB family hemolysin secretion/activation protein n=1 Tax=Massilia sp. Root418 TaxID=1736532 RepID=UPI00070190EB|nr:ShlB/FhaC/HecB family hemolysin secretion/activation protein [Massilia sp. Root418]KQW93333.1 hypothetical protein ASC94_11855 [Massilia sp. Root418]
MSKMNHMEVKARAAALAILLAPAAVFAQTVPDAGGVLESNRPPALIPPLRSGAKVVPDVKAQTGAALPGDQKVYVKGYAFKGNTAFTEQELARVLAPYAGREVSFGELGQAALAISAHYRAHGYLIASAALPPQELAQGVVTIQVLEGRLSGVRLVPDASVRVNQELVRRYLDGVLRPGQPLKEDELERAMLLVEDLPGVNARAELSPGAQFGETAVDIGLSEGPMFNGNVSLDNSSNRYTGRTRISGGLNVDDIGGQGGQLSALASTTGSDFNYGRLGYVMPVGGAGTRAGLAHSRMRYKLGKEFASLDSSGSANISQVLVTHPLLRSRFRNVQLRAGYDDKRYENSARDVQISDKLVRNVTVGLSLNMQDEFGGGGLVSATADVTRGDVDLSRNAAFAAGDAAGPGTAGRFTRFNYQLSRIQALVPGVTLLASVGGQLASGNLESGEKLSLGGVGRVRAYPAGEASGDAGHTVTLETHWDMPVYKLDLSVFYDIGRVTLVRSPYAGALSAGTPNKYSLQGAGVGVSWRPLAKTVASLQIATKIGSNPVRAANGDDSDGTSSRTRAWVQIARYF